VAAALAATVFLLLPTQPAGAIVGGSPADWSEHPYFVRFDTPVVCGGTVIAPDVVLTAAHCVDEGTTPSQVTMGLSNGQESIGVAITIHPLWNGLEYRGHDLAVVRTRPGRTAGIRPMQVGAPYDGGDVYYRPGTLATVLGTGFLFPGGPRADGIRRLVTPIRSDGDMSDVYDLWPIIDHWTDNLMIGAGERDYTVCNGDSGGPLVSIGPRGFALVGVASFVETFPDDCGEPGGFMELSGPQLAWVASVVPEIRGGWGTCIAPSGARGRYAASWGPTPASGPQRELYFDLYTNRGTYYYWRIWCVELPAPDPVMSGDFSGDGRSDLVLTGAPTFTGLPMAASNGDGTFTTTNGPAADFAGWASVPGVRSVTGDFDKDGRTDLALLPGPDTPWWITIPVAFSNGDGTFRITNTLSRDFAGWAQAPGGRVTTGDFDKDGRTDIALTPGPNSPWWYTLPVAFANGDGTFRITNSPAQAFASWAQM
jgi:hypothetical protein